MCILRLRFSGGVPYAELVLPLRFISTDLTLSEGRICGYAETDEDVDDAVDEQADEDEAEDDAEGELAEERGDPRSGLFSVFSALSAR
jgi:hypothetical protein